MARPQAETGDADLLERIEEHFDAAPRTAARRRGIGAAVTGRLAQDARQRGAEIAFLSAAGEQVARMYERLGFRRVGTACFAFPRDT